MVSLAGHLAWKYPDSKVHEANMGPIWVRQDPGGPHVGPLNFAIWVLDAVTRKTIFFRQCYSWYLW